MLHARKVDINIKTGQEKAFKDVFEGKVLPILQKQSGFQDELLLVNDHKATAISLWDNRGSAEAYDKAEYSKVTELLRPVTEGTPQVCNCEVAFATHTAPVPA